jgi:hypothetical protein
MPQPTNATPALAAQLADYQRRWPDEKDTVESFLALLEEPGDPFVRLEVRIGDAELAGAVTQDAQLLVGRVMLEPVVLLRHVGRRFGFGRLHAVLRAAALALLQLALERLVDQAILQLRGESGQAFAGHGFIHEASIVKRES